ncbi:MAG: FHA domain-containing protein, partial [Myxococcales bacterium]|nr:FHA domain-containing protein [Myxococcales bacterium]
MKVQLRVVDGPDVGRTFTFETRDRFLIGRAPTAHFQITDPFFSRHHLMLEVNPPNVLLQDLQSTNGSFVNDVRAAAPVALRHGDTVGGGKTRIQLAIEEPAPVAPQPPPRAAPGAPPGKLDLSRVLGAADPNEKVPIRCLRCGARAANEVPRARAENMAYFCDACQVALLAEPKLLPG